MYGKNFLKTVTALFLSALIVCAGISGIAAADRNIRRNAFSSHEPLLSVRADSENDSVVVNAAGKTLIINMSYADELLKCAEKWRMLLPAQLRVCIESAVFMGARIIEFIRGN